MVKALQPELIFEVTRHHRGNFSARCLNADLSLTGANLQELHDNISVAIEQMYPFQESRPTPAQIHLMVFDDESPRGSRTQQINSWQ